MRRDIYEEIVEARRSGKRAALATIVAQKGSTPRRDPAKMLVFQTGQQIGSIGGGCVEAEVCREALLVMASEKPRLMSFELKDDDTQESGLLCGGTMEVYVEPILPIPNLVILGAGHVGQCVASIATTIGFELTIVDDRIKYASKDRFPEAESLIVDPWESALQRLEITESSYILIATRGHQYDLCCLRFAVQSSAKYVGLLGSRRKTRLLFETLEREGLDPSLFKKVFAPVGLEVGSETPEEIAISIAAELVAIRKNLDVQPLKKSLRHLRPAERLKRLGVS